MMIQKVAFSSSFLQKMRVCGSDVIALCRHNDTFVCFIVGRLPWHVINWVTLFKGKKLSASERLTCSAVRNSVVYINTVNVYYLLGILLNILFFLIFPLYRYRKARRFCKFLWTTQSIKDTTGGPPLVCGQQTTGANSEDNTWQTMGKEHWNTRTATLLLAVVPLYLSLNIVRVIKSRSKMGRSCSQNGRILTSKLTERSLLEWTIL